MTPTDFDKAVETLVRGQWSDSIFLFWSQVNQNTLGCHYPRGGRTFGCPGAHGNLHHTSSPAFLIGWAHHLLESRFLTFSSMPCSVVFNHMSMEMESSSSATNRSWWNPSLPVYLEKDPPLVSLLSVYYGGLSCFLFKFKPQNYQVELTHPKSTLKFDYIASFYIIWKLSFVTSNLGFGHLIALPTFHLLSGPKEVRILWWRCIGKIE